MDALLRRTTGEEGAEIVVHVRGHGGDVARTEEEDRGSARSRGLGQARPHGHTSASARLRRRGKDQAPGLVAPVEIILPSRSRHLALRRPHAPNPGPTHRKTAGTATQNKSKVSILTTKLFPYNVFSFPLNYSVTTHMASILFVIVYVLVGDWGCGGGAITQFAVGGRGLRRRMQWQLRCSAEAAAVFPDFPAVT